LNFLIIITDIKVEIYINNAYSTSFQGMLLTLKAVKTLNLVENSVENVDISYFNTNFLLC